MSTFKVHLRAVSEGKPGPEASACRKEASLSKPCQLLEMAVPHRRVMLLSQLHE